jgi:hydroxymethylbilane synthase
MRAILAPLNDPATWLAVSAERMVSRQLGGSCQVPLAAHAVWNGAQLELRSFVASPDGLQICEAAASSPVVDLVMAEVLGLKVADDLILQGAAALIPAPLP